MHPRVAGSQLVTTAPVSCASATSAQMRFAAGPSEARAARGFMTETLAGWGVSRTVIGLAVLVANELVINAITHGVPLDSPGQRVLRDASAGGWISLRRGLGSRRPVSIAGRSSQLWAGAAAQPDLDGEGGRGLYVVNSIADCWGVRVTRGVYGKWVWARLVHAAEEAS